MLQLFGYLDSPFVRRVAITMRFLDIEYKHRELSIFRDFEAFRNINPVVKVPTVVLDDGGILVDSNLIIDYLESQLAHRSLMPANPVAYRVALQHIGTALVGMEKVAQLIYETGHRPEERQHGAWIKRVRQQLVGAVNLMESFVSARADTGDAWLLGPDISQADITIAVAWRLMQHIETVNLDPHNYPELANFSERAEALPEFLACPLNG